MLGYATAGMRELWLRIVVRQALMAILGRVLSAAEAKIRNQKSEIVSRKSEIQGLVAETAGRMPSRLGGE